MRASVPAAGKGRASRPSRDLVRAAVGGGEGDEAAVRLGPLRAGRPDAATVEASLRSLLGLGDGSTAEHTWALRRLFETLAERGPLVVVLDDLHWAGSGLLDLVEDAARWTRGRCSCSARPGLTCSTLGARGAAACRARSR
jgi:hypothetical protein